MKQITFCKITNVENILKNPKKEFHEVDNPVKAYKLTINTGTEERIVVSAKTYLLIKEKMIEEKKKFKHTDKAKELIKQSSLGRPSYWKGKTRDAEFKLQAYERMKGNQFSKGVSKSEETKQKLREKNKGQKRSEETKQKMRKPKTGQIEKGKPWTEARRQAQINKKNKNADSFNQ